MEGKDEFQIRLNDLPEISKQELIEMRLRELDKPYNLRGNATALLKSFYKEVSAKIVDSRTCQRTGSAFQSAQ